MAAWFRPQMTWQSVLISSTLKLFRLRINRFHIFLNQKKSCRKGNEGSGQILVEYKHKIWDTKNVKEGVVQMKKNQQKVIDKPKDKIQNGTLFNRILFVLWLLKKIAIHMDIECYVIVVVLMWGCGHMGEERKAEKK